MPQTPVFIVAARRTALGRIGGLHRGRRIGELSGPVVSAALADCGVAPDQIEGLILGNASEGGNPARVIALAAGLSDTVSASTIDSQCGSGLEAILSAARMIASGDADLMIAGGAEALSTAPWRIAKPKSLYQLPHFVGLEPRMTDLGDEPQAFEAAERLATRLNIRRAEQDAYAFKSYLKAEGARSAKRFVGEIVPLRGNAEEARDQSAIEPTPQDLELLTPFLPPEGGLTPGNTSSLHDGAAFVVLASESAWHQMGRPRALKLVMSAAQGVASDDAAAAPIEAMRKLYTKLNGLKPAAIGAVELSESSAAQAIALMRALDLDERVLNSEGGAIARGHPFGAASAVLVVRLFTRMLRSPDKSAPKHGVATVGAIGGLGLAALFEAV